MTGLSSDEPVDLVVRGGTVVTPTETRRMDVGVVNGRIAALGTIRRGREVIDATGLFVLPGAVDGHTHLDIALGASTWSGVEDWRATDGGRSADDYFSGTVKAACGGVTTIVDYAKQETGQTIAATIAERRDKAEGQAVIDFAFHLMPMDFSDEMFGELPVLLTSGYPTAKVMTEFASDAQLLRLLRTVGQSGGLTMVHCGNTAIDDDAIARLLGARPVPARSYPDAKPIAGELEGVRRALSFCSYTGAPVCLVHISSRAAVAEIARAKGDSIPVWAETRPCYLLLTRERYEDPAPRHLMYMGYPPLREQDSVDALWEAVRSGVIDTIASDHVAWSMQQKAAGELDFTLAPMGLPSLETQVGALFSEGVNGGRLDLRRFVEVVSSNPARLLGLYPRKGAVALGSDADLVLIDPNEEHVVHPQEMGVHVDHDPLEGMEFRGWPVLTLSRGEVVARKGRFVGRRGHGALLLRERFDPQRSSEPEPKDDHPMR